MSTVSITHVLIFNASLFGLGFCIGALWANHRYGKRLAELHRLYRKR